MRIFAFAAGFILFFLAGTANAQPSMMAPGSPQSYPHTLALPPLPFTAHSPMPSLPPPPTREASEHNSLGTNTTLHQPGFDAKILEDGRLIINANFLHTGLSSDPTVGPRMGATFDLTDILSPSDPYLAQKRALFEDTFDQRATLRGNDNKRVMDRALGALPTYLAAVWHQPEWDPVSRRQLLFALWDECAEGNAQNAKEGAIARKMIEGFIAQNLPKSSGRGFTDEEVRRLNGARTSLAAFAPQ